MIEGFYYTVEEKMQAEHLEQFIEKNELWNSVFFSDLHTYNSMLEIAKRHLEEGRINVAIHILTPIAENVSEYYKYDVSAGTFDTPTPIDSIDELYEAYDYELYEYIEKRKKEGLPIFLAK